MIRKNTSGHTQKRAAVTWQTKQKMKESATDRRHSYETKIKIGNALRHRTRTDEQKLRYSQAKSGEKSPSAKLKAVQVLEIRERLKQGEAYREIALEMGVSWQNIRCIDLGKTWKSILTEQQKIRLEETGRLSPRKIPKNKKERPIQLSA